jgi:hypothetical protein
MKHHLLTTIAAVVLVGYASIYPNTEKEIRYALKDIDTIVPGQVAYTLPQFDKKPGQP